MTGTLLVKADGTSCGASIVKTSADCPREAPRCQRILSTPTQISFDPGEIVDASGRLFSGAALHDEKSLTVPLADPSAPPVIPKWEKSAFRHQRINLRADGRCLCRPEVITRAKHRSGAPDFFQPMAHLVAAVLHQFAQELEHLIEMGCRAHGRIRLRNHGGFYWRDTMRQARRQIRNCSAGLSGMWRQGTITG